MPKQKSNVQTALKKLIVFNGFANEENVFPKVGHSPVLFFFLGGGVVFFLTIIPGTCGWHLPKKLLANAGRHLFCSDGHLHEQGKNGQLLSSPLATQNLGSNIAKIDHVWTDVWKILNHLNPPTRQWLVLGSPKRRETRTDCQGQPVSLWMVHPQKSAKKHRLMMDLGCLSRLKRDKGIAKRHSRSWKTRSPGTPTARARARESHSAHFLPFAPRLAEWSDLGERKTLGSPLEGQSKHYVVRVGSTPRYVWDVNLPGHNLAYNEWVGATSMMLANHLIRGRTRGILASTQPNKTIRLDHICPSIHL